ncbi:hypothetical protein [Streptomyces sp. NPDC046805]|uniref:hypothetical protein n=1 Tax=Streptomyces sp. NPDC046805 TaxID=3155134 RepID=UPI0033D6E2AE
MAFGAEELCVLRRALALALHPGPASAEDVQDCLRLAESLDEALREGARLRAFVVADLGRYRAALPGTAAGYLALLDEVLGAGYRPTADDLAALRALRGNPTAAALLERLDRLDRRANRDAAPGVPASRGCIRLLALPGGSAGDGQDKKPTERPSPQPAPQKPSRPIPTPGEVFPRRKPPTSPSGPNPPRQRLAAG